MNSIQTVHLRREMINSRIPLPERLSGYTQKCLVFMSMEALWIKSVLPPGTFVNLTEIFKTSVTADQQIYTIHLYLWH